MSTTSTRTEFQACRGFYHHVDVKGPVGITEKVQLGFRASILPLRYNTRPMGIRGFGEYDSVLGLQSAELEC